MHSWQAEVYHPRIKDKNTTKLWLKLRNKVLERDSYICQMCKESYFTRKLILQAHHLKPRKDGGRNQMRNLITLCIKCHDLAEMEQMNRKDIINYDIESERIEKILMKEVCRNKDWHKWVYGGYKRPDQED